MKKTPPESAFSFIELTIGLVLTGLIGTFAYRTFTSQVTSQYADVALQRLDKQALQGIDLFRRDVASFDYNWTMRSIGPLSFQAGLGPGGSDWLTIPMPDPTFPYLMQFESTVEPGTTAGKLFDAAIFHALKKAVPGAGLLNGDLVLIYRTKQFRFARVAERDVDGNGKIVGIRLALLNTGDIATSSTPGLTPLFPSPLSDFPGNDTTIQKVKKVTYRLKETQEGAKSVRYLSRTENNVEALLGKLDRFNLLFDEKTSTGVRQDIAVPTDWANVRAVKAQMSGVVSTGKQRNWGMKVALTGTNNVKAYSDGEVTVTPTNNLANLSVGGPALEVYADGTKRVFVPSIQFGTLASNSVGKVAIVDGDTGNELGNVTLSSGGNPFLASSVAVLSGGSSSAGLVIGGYMEVGGNRSAALAFYPRDSLSKKINVGATPVVTVLPNPGDGSLLYDTMSVTVIDSDIYVASYTKGSGADTLRIYKTTHVGSGSFSTPTKVHEETASVGEVLLTSLGVGPEIGDRSSLAFGRSNSAGGVGDGSIWLMERDANGDKADPPHKVADADYEPRGLAADAPGHLYIGERLRAGTMSQTAIQEILLGSATPPALNLDNQNGSGFYYDSCVVDSSLIKTGAPVSGQTIRSVGGIAIRKDSPVETQLALTNDDPSGSKDASVTEVAMTGSPPLVHALVKPSMPNVNASLVAFARTESYQNLPYTNLPPCNFPSNPTRTTPSETCSRPLPADASGWFSCFCQRFGQCVASVTPTPTPIATATPTATPSPTPTPTVTPTVTPTPDPDATCYPPTPPRMPLCIICSDEQCAEPFSNWTTCRGDTNPDGYSGDMCMMSVRCSHPGWNLCRESGDPI